MKLRFHHNDVKRENQRDASVGEKTQQEIKCLSLASNPETSSSNYRKENFRCDVALVMPKTCACTRLGVLWCDTRTRNVRLPLGFLFTPMCQKFSII